ncbi:MAG: hypothetical protein IAE86_04180 [Burkholderiaceae bacterium]|nr:hypothetical protein [Burkholderiaceae bacterium]
MIATEPQRDMSLTPRRPPGRSTRKARAFADEIARLHADGYTCDAIREALADAGVYVSTSTVQREVTRHTCHHGRAAAARVLTLARPAAAHSQITPSATKPDLPPSEQSHAELRGKDIAQAFVDKRITNSLLRKRTQEQP